MYSSINLLLRLGSVALLVLPVTGTTAVSGTHTTLSPMLRGAYSHENETIVDLYELSTEIYQVEVDNDTYSSTGSGGEDEHGAVDLRRLDSNSLDGSHSYGRGLRLDGSFEEEIAGQVSELKATTSSRDHETAGRESKGDFSSSASFYTHAREEMEFESEAFVTDSDLFDTHINETIVVGDDKAFEVATP
jgi:hypothetical protein